MKRLANWLDRIGISATLTESMSAGVEDGLDDFRDQMAAGYDVLFSNALIGRTTWFGLRWLGVMPGGGSA